MNHEGLAVGDRVLVMYRDPERWAWPDREGRVLAVTSDGKRAKVSRRWWFAEWLPVDGMFCKLKRIKP